MHGLQNQCSCSVPPQPRSCPRSGLPSSSFTSMQTPHGFPGRGCGGSPSGILRRGIVCRTIGPLHGRGRARSGRWDGRCLAVAAGPCVWLVARLYMLVVVTPGSAALLVGRWDSLMWESWSLHLLHGRGASVVAQGDALGGAADR